MTPFLPHRKKHVVNQMRATDGTFMSIQTDTTLAPEDAELDKPLVTVSVQNPFKKLLHWIDQIRRNQSTTFSIKLKLPLIVTITLFVLGVSLVTSSKLFYDWGKLAGLSAVLAMPDPTPAVLILPTATPAPVETTKLGILKGLYTTDTNNPTRYVLEDREGQIIIILAPATLSLKQYIGNRVLLTGMYEETGSTLKIQKGSDIEVLQ